MPRGLTDLFDTERPEQETQLNELLMSVRAFFFFSQITLVAVVSCDLKMHKVSKIKGHQNLHKEVVGMIEDLKKPKKPNLVSIF